MKGVMIKPEELGALKDVKLVYGFTDRVMMQIYNFYKMHSQDEYYFLDLDGVQDLFAFYDRDYIDMYARFGIVINNEDINSTRERLLILDTSEVNESKISEKVRKLGDHVSCCIIEKDYSSLGINAYSSDRYELTVLDKIGVKILNPGFISAAALDYDVRNLELVKKATDRDGNRLYHLYDVSNIMNTAVLLDNFDRSIEAMFSVIDQFRDIATADPKTVFYYSDRRNTVVTNTYLCIAARMLLTDGYKFLVNRDDITIHRMFMRDFTGPRFRYVDDYLHFIERFPDFSLKFSNEAAFLMVRDRVKEYQNRHDYKVSFRALCAEVDLDNRKLLEPFTKVPVEIDLSSVETISFPEYFGLSNSREIGGVFREANTFANTIDEAIRSVYPYDDFILNCCNLLLFKNHGRTYVSYVISIQAKYPFKVRPLSDKFPSFTIDLDLSQLLSLYDVRLLFGLDTVVQEIASNHSAYDVLDFSRKESDLNGCVLRCLTNNWSNSIHNDRLTSEDLAMWSDSTESIRHKSPALTSLFSIKQLQKRGIIGYYGGPIPYTANHLIVTDDLWR